jgi:hypothetical protein
MFVMFLRPPSSPRGLAAGSSIVAVVAISGYRGQAAVRREEDICSGPFVKSHRWET